MSDREYTKGRGKPHRFASSDLEDFSWKPDWSLDRELLVLGTVDEISRDCGDGV